VFVVVFGAMRHTARQSHLDDAFRVRVAGGHADGPNWRPLPGQAIATISIPAIGVREVVVQDTTPELLEDGPGHLLGTPLPGQAGNAVILGRRITDGAAFRNVGELSPGDPITVVTPQGAFAYSVSQVTRVLPGQPDVLAPTSDARLTLITSGSWFFSRDRLAVIASLQGTPITPGPIPQIQLRSAQLGGTGDTNAVVPLLPWAVALVLAFVAWTRIRRGIGSRRARFLVATPILLFVLFFLFENAANLLPGSV
jgi:sortase A